MPFSHRCTLSGYNARAGSNAYYCASPPPPGQALVEHDGQRWLYTVRRGERRAFRAWLADVFAGTGTARVAGRWPAYDIETTR